MPNSTRSTTDFRVLIKGILDGDKFLLFLKAVDAKDWRELGNFLEDETQPNGLVADWEAVKKACSRLDKCRQREEETNMEDESASDLGGVGFLGVFQKFRPK